ncbi:hypothetical protein FKM82_022033 [Ascaphus truei]
MDSPYIFKKRHSSYVLCLSVVLKAMYMSSSNTVPACKNTITPTITRITVRNLSQANMVSGIFLYGKKSPYPLDPSSLPEVLRLAKRLPAILCFKDFHHLKKWWCHLLNEHF